VCCHPVAQQEQQMKLPIFKKMTTGFSLILAVNISLPYQNALRLTKSNNSVVTLLQPQQPDSVDALIIEKLTHLSETLVSRPKQSFEDAQLQLVSLPFTGTGENQGIIYV
jgi:hypothetical protein